MSLWVVFTGIGGGSCQCPSHQLSLGTSEEDGNIHTSPKQKLMRERPREGPKAGTPPPLGKCRVPLEFQVVFCSCIFASTVDCLETFVVVTTWGVFQGCCEIAR